MSITPEIFCAYVRQDEAWLRKLETHLSLLKRQGLISVWHDRLLSPGIDWMQAIDAHLEAAAIILLLISADFLASNYCYGVEIKRALERQEAGEARVIPLLLRPVDWAEAPFAHLQALPTNAKPLATWKNQESALADVAASLRQVIKELTTTVPPVALPTIWNVPYLRNLHFTGRDELLDRLHQQLSPRVQDNPMATHRAALTQPQAIKGLGGIGKTQIAIEYAYRSREQGHYAHTFWINAASEEALLTSFVALAKLLPLFSAKNETNQQKLVAAIRHWLEQCKQRWLLIFDNADEISLIREYLPRQGNGSILLTTRADAVGSLAASVEVTNMGLIEGTEFLLRRAQHHLASDEERDEATNVAIALDCFPLALDQAGAYIEETGCSFVEYLKVYQDHWKELLARRGEQATRYPSSVATTWSLSFQKVEQANPAAAELLHLCAYLSPDRIPEELIRDGAIHWKPPLQQAVTDLFTFNQMIEELLKFSLVKRLSETHMLSIHRLVQVVQMDLMDQEEQRHWAERVIRAVNAVFPLDPQKEMSTWPQCLRYLEQAQACDRLIQQHAFVFSEAADLLERVATYLREHASYALAEPLYTRALSIREQHTASNLNDLAVLYRQQSKYVEAEPLYQRSLHIWEHQLGPEHPEVATSLNNLALLYDEQGKYTEAEPLYQHALRIWEQLGAEHPHVANPLNGLANLYHLQRKYTEAEPLYQRALRIREQQLGPEHPHVAFALNNLATLYVEQGKYIEAESLYQQALHIVEPQLGLDHPYMASTLSNLATLYREQGKYTEAELLYQRALRIWEQRLGPEHPETTVTIHNLARLREVQGNSEEARSLYTRVLSIREQALGKHHPKTTETRTRLIALLHTMSQDEEAAQLETAWSEYKADEEERKALPEE